MSTPRPATPILDAWQKLMRQRYGHPLPAEAISTEIGSPLWRAAAWERSALQAWQDGGTPETIADDLLRPYREYATALTHRRYRHAAHLTDRQLAALERVMHARSLTVREKLAVLKLAETEEVNLHAYECYERNDDNPSWGEAKRDWLKERKATA